MGADFDTVWGCCSICKALRQALKVNKRASLQGLWLIVLLFLSACVLSLGREEGAAATAEAVDWQQYVPTATPSPSPTAVLPTPTAALPGRAIRLISTETLFSVENPTVQDRRYPVWNGAFYPSRGDTYLRVDVEVRPGDATPEGSSAGFFVENAPAPGRDGKGRPGYRALFVGRQSGLWVVQFWMDGEVHSLDRFLTQDDFREVFVLRLVAGGQRLELQARDGEVRSLDFPAPLYALDQPVSIVLQAPGRGALRVAHFEVAQTGEIAAIEGGGTKSLRQVAEGRGISIGVNSNAWSFAADPRHAKLIGREFKLLSLTEMFDWQSLRPAASQFDFSLADQLVNYGLQQDMRLRGALLPSARQENAFPEWVQAGAFDRQQWLEAINYHSEAVLSRYAGEIKEWVVASDTIWQGRFVSTDLLWNAAGEDAIAHAFRYAHKLDPQATLIYGFDRNERKDGQSNTVYSYIERLVKQDVPVNGVGLKAHLFLSNPPKKEVLLANMRRYADLKVDIYILEADVNLYDGRDGVLPGELETQAQIYHDLLWACFRINQERGEPVCKSFTLWDASDASGRPPLSADVGGWEAANVFDGQYQPKPAYKVLYRLLESGPE